jgi:hypothetical protein
MDQTAILNDQIARGRGLIEHLDQKGLSIQAAFWFYFDDPDSESGTWKLIIASPEVDLLGHSKFYRKIWEELRILKDKIGISPLEVYIASPNDELVQLMKIAIVTGPKDLAGIRFTSNVVGGQFVKDAYIYRLSVAE